LGEGFAGWTAGRVVVGDLGEDLEEVLDYVLGALCGERVRWCGWIGGGGGVPWTVWRSAFSGAMVTVICGLRGGSLWWFETNWNGSVEMLRSGTRLRGSWV
jgi:hypothetical protein